MHAYAQPAARNDSCTPFLFQVPWGKHNPYARRGVLFSSGGV